MACGDPIRHLADDFPSGCGPLGLLSGDEFLPAVSVFDRAVIAASGPRIGLVLCADHRAAPKSAGFARAHFASLGAEVVDDDLLHGGRDPEVDVVYLAGGSPPGLLACLRDAWPDIERRWVAGAALIGSSAGAMALCEHCLIPEPGASAPTVWSRGVGPVRGVGLAVHASSRSREWIGEIARSAPAPTVALDDRTGILLAAGGEPAILGEGSVWVVPRGTRGKR